MRYVAVLLMAIVTNAAGQQPAEFRSAAPVTPAPGDALQRLTPLKVYATSAHW